MAFGLNPDSQRATWRITFTSTEYWAANLSTNALTTSGGIGVAVEIGLGLGVGFFVGFGVGVAVGSGIGVEVSVGAGVIEAIEVASARTFF